MPTDKAILYQLEKVDQGGEVSDMFEDRAAFLANEWGYTFTEGGEILLPDGRLAGLKFEAYITNEGGSITKRLARNLTEDPL